MHLIERLTAWVKALLTSRAPGRRARSRKAAPEPVAVRPQTPPVRPVSRVRWKDDGLWAVVDELAIVGPYLRLHEERERERRPRRQLGPRRIHGVEVAR
jgi:hypothetical protein